MPFPIQAVVEIPEGDLPVFGDGVLNGVHIIVDGFVHALDPAADQYVPAHEPGVVDAALAAQLFNQFPGFLFREEAAGLDGVDEQLQFRQLEVPGGNVVTPVFSGNRDNIHPVILQSRNVGIDGFALADNIVLLFQHGQQLRRSHRVILVGVFLQIIQNIEDFQLLIIRLWHEISPFPVISPL